MPPEPVECRSEHTYAQNPCAVWSNHQRLEITAIESALRIPQGRAFRVKTAQGQRFDLFYNELKDEWTVQER